MKRTYEEKPITVILKDGTTETYEHCLDIHTKGQLLYSFPYEDHILVSTYPVDDVAMIAEGCIEKLEVD